VSCRFSGNNFCVPEGRARVTRRFIAGSARKMFRVPEGRLPFYFSPLPASLLHIRIILDIVIGRASLKIP
jgi:hypothetical protein